MARKRVNTTIDTMIGIDTEIIGNLGFTGGLHIDGKVKGNIFSDDENALLTISDTGVVEGNIKVNRILLNGTIRGDAYALNKIELSSRARVFGNVYYNLIEMGMGAEVNGQLIRKVESNEPKKILRLEETIE
ncbi:MAG: polymer-forming cytoskeletal protein [Gammaproteobacteria bacterium]|nr:polymer-forming cytoskeletal protein [Gammaproteobacteria bacterium]MDH5777227.1 polymer-forming cytoskeletal protein [Gammaproteobacteria bacterium]